MSGLREAIAKALEPYDIPTGAWTAAEKAEPIDAILAAIESMVVGRSDLEQIGWFSPSLRHFNMPWQLNPDAPKYKGDAVAVYSLCPEQST